MWNEAAVSGAALGTWFAVSSGQTIVAVAQAVPDSSGSTTLTFLVPPSLAHAGRMRLAVDQVSGDPAAPALAAVSLR